MTPEDVAAYLVSVFGSPGPAANFSTRQQEDRSAKTALLIANARRAPVVIEAGYTMLNAKQWVRALTKCVI